MVHAEEVKQSTKTIKELPMKIIFDKFKKVDLANKCCHLWLHGEPNSGKSYSVE